ncbi:undecaprenyldiphospho-muramoylpentapeptide beta-N-acetylglucosaminyltransferase [Candidatus Parcubacteria bacterium]|nr:MAG: undecaprenyldiphospho-muramoylpentapeptide beta-N-acetylglucosaminyltransferase [Candidatus Parcubacteria bacterium]
MKILLTGGGTGGHFYPLIAVARAINSVADQEKIAKLELTYMAEKPYDRNLLLQNGIKFKKVYSGKMRRYFSLLNIVDLFKLGPGLLKSVTGMYFDFPDVVFSKGGYDSFPALFAAKILGIPVMIHESDAIPGKANLWAGKFARRIAVSFPSAAESFPKEKTAVTGNPARKEFFIRDTLGAKEFFKLETDVPTIFVFGGSQGARIINDNLLDGIAELIQDYQVIHQTGEKNYEECRGRAEIILADSKFKQRYKAFPFLRFDEMRIAYGAAEMVVSRAGGSAIFEIAASGLPSIIIPIFESAQDHQRENAYSYAKSGAAVVIEENNLKPHILKSEIDRIFSSKEEMKAMSEAAKLFAKPDAAEKIAREIIRLAIEHK